MKWFGRLDIPRPADLSDQEWDIVVNAISGGNPGRMVSVWNGRDNRQVGLSIPIPMKEDGSFDGEHWGFGQQ